MRVLSITVLPSKAYPEVSKRSQLFYMPWINTRLPIFINILCHHALNLRSNDQYMVLSKSMIVTLNTDIHRPIQIRIHDAMRLLLLKKVEAGRSFYFRLLFFILALVCADEFLMLPFFTSFYTIILFYQP